MWSAGEDLPEAELRFRSIVEAANDAVILADSLGKILSMNPATTRMFAYGDDLIGQPVSTLVPERHRKAHRDAFLKLNEAGLSRLIGKTFELYGLRKDGTEFPMELSLATWKIGDKPFYCG